MLCRRSLVLLAVLATAACRDESMTLPDVTSHPPDVVDASRGMDAGADAPAADAPSTMDTPATMDTTPGTDTPTPPSDVSDTDSCSTPSTLHPPTLDAGTRNLYCPFSNPDGGRARYCNSGTEHCCEPSGGTSTCQPLATPCAAREVDWQCEDPVADCATGQACCGMGMLVLGGPGCGNYATGFHGTHCATSCPAGEIVMCTSTSECPRGQTCVPFKVRGNSVGGCM